MARANRHFVPGLVWHITQRCHERKFLLKFARDRRRWRHWLFQATRRYGLSVLSYTVTSNHIHLLVYDTGHDEIASSMQLIAGRTAQEFNRRKSRRGAFWGDRYHATAVQSDEHLSRCMVYVDFNMVRAGVVSHPREWEHGAYREIQHPPCRRGVIDTQRLMSLFKVNSPAELAEVCEKLVELELDAGPRTRQPEWTESVAVGGSNFVTEVKRRLGVRGCGKSVVDLGSTTMLRESAFDYEAKKG